MLAGDPLLGGPADGVATPPWEGAVAKAPGAADVLGRVTKAGNTTGAAAGATTVLGGGAERSTAGLGVAPGAGPVDMRPEGGGAWEGSPPDSGGPSDAPAERVFIGKKLGSSGK